MRALLSIALAMALAAPVAAQAWQIPARGVAEFGRTIERFALTPDGGEPSRRAADGLFGPIWPRALLFEGELDADDQRIELPPWDLRMLARFVALDLSTAAYRGRRRLTVPRMRSFGDVQMSIEFAPADTGSRQSIECMLASRVPGRERGEDPRYVDRYVEPYASRSLEGSLRIDRSVDLERGLVTRFRAELDVTVGGGRGGRLALAESWVLRRVRENRDAEFERDVHAAIDRGAKWVRGDLAGIHKHVGAGVPREDEVVQRGFDELRKREILDSYSLGIALMALEALYTPITEREDLVRGVIPGPYERRPSDEDRRAIERFAARLLANIDRRVDSAYLVRFNYTPAGRYDNSVTQYALLGLYAAQLCGVPQSPRFWRAAAEHWVEQLTDARGGVVLSLVSNREFHSSRQYDAEQRTVSAARVVARGWGYQAAGGGNPTFDYGSMTVAGLAGLAICQSALRGLDARPLATADDAARSGFAWLARHLRFDTNPNQYRTDQRWLYYYLYGLERACELHGVALINDRDWYFEGATTLLDLQLKDGTWPAEGPGSANYGFALERTCFAVLFLRKESLPVFTPR